MGTSKLLGKHLKVVLFDHDDTLVGTIEPKWAEHKHIARTFYGKELTDDKLRQHWGKPLTTLIGLLYETDDVETAMNHNKALHHDFPKVLRADTIATLQALRKSGLKTGVITATSRFSFSYDLESMGIPLELFDYTQTEDDTVYHKPDFRVFDPAIEWLTEQNIKPDEVLYIGDGLHDMQAALGAGFEFIGITTGLVTQDSFTANGALTITKLSDLLAA